jgi:hypothetical protein
VVKVGPNRILHAEYVTHPDSKVFGHMITYRGLITEEFPATSIRQYAIVLGRGKLPTFDQPENGFSLGLRVIYLSDVDPEVFLARPGLAALAELAQGDQETRARSALRAIKLIRTLPPHRQAKIFEGMINLAVLVLQPSIIDRIRKEIGMTVESVAAFYNQTEVGQELVRQGLEKGREEGHEDTYRVLLRARFGDDPQIPLIAKRLARFSDAEAVINALDRAEALDRLTQWTPPTEP